MEGFTTSDVEDSATGWNPFDHSDDSNEVHYERVELDEMEPMEDYTGSDTAAMDFSPTLSFARPNKPTVVGVVVEQSTTAVVKKGRGGARTGAGRKAVPKEPKKRAARSEFFTFTVQLNYDEFSSLQQLSIFKNNLKDMVDSGDVGYYSVGHEIAPQTGRHHLQGYLETSSHDVRWTYDQFKSLITKDMEKTQDGTDRIWAKESRGSATENLTYTGKAIAEGRWYGHSEADVEFRNYGRGNKLGKIRTMIDSGTPMLDIAKQHFDDWTKYRGAFKEYKQMIAKPRQEPTKITWVHGSTGTGKSQWALRQYPPSDKVYWLDPPKNGNVWWDGYDGHDIVVVDEVKPNTFGLGHAGFAYVLRLLDSTPLRVGVHGGKVNFAPKLMVFTANFPPSEWFKKDYCSYGWDAENPLYRRFSDFGNIVLWRSNEDYWRGDTWAKAQLHAANQVVVQEKIAAQAIRTQQHKDALYAFRNPGAAIDARRQDGSDWSLANDEELRMWFTK